MENSKNIYPVFDQILKREHKEKLLNQKSKIIWLTGLSGSGKTTLAKGLEKELHNRGFLVQVLDGDNIRSGINNNLGFTEKDRLENIRRIAEVSKLLLNSGVITINSFISPTNEIRSLAKKIVGKKDFIEVFVNAPFEVCAKRDVKGLYKKAMEGKIKNFTGLNSPFDKPINPDLEVDTSNQTEQESIKYALEYILPQITL